MDLQDQHHQQQAKALFDELNKFGTSEEEQGLTKSPNVGGEKHRKKSHHHSNRSGKTPRPGKSIAQEEDLDYRRDLIKVIAKPIEIDDSTNTNNNNTNNTNTTTTNKNNTKNSKSNNIAKSEKNTKNEKNTKSSTSTAAAAPTRKNQQKPQNTPRENHPMGKIYEQFKELESKVISNLLEKRADSHLLQLHTISTELIINDMEFSTKKSIASRLWKVSYSVIDAKLKIIRKLQKVDSTTPLPPPSPSPSSISLEPIESSLNRLLTDLSRSYHNLLEKTTQFYSQEVNNAMSSNHKNCKENEKNFAANKNRNKNNYHHSGGGDNENNNSNDNEDGNGGSCGNEMNSAAMVCYCCLIALGDLSRYSKEWERAEFFYQRSLLLLPQNGKPHNQLAIVTMNTLEQTNGQYWLGLMYRYFRSIACTDPFPARENLISFFEKNRLVEAELNKGGKTNKHNNNNNNNNPAMRDIDKALVRFVRLNGILFNRISLETFDASCGKFFASFEMLVGSGAIDGILAAKMLICAVFMVHDSLPPATSLSHGPLQSALTLGLNYALSLLFDLCVCFVRGALCDGSRLFVLVRPLAVFLEWVRACPAVLSWNSESASCLWEAVGVLLNATSHLTPSQNLSGLEPSPELLEARGFNLIPIQCNAENLWGAETSSTSEFENIAFESSIIRLRGFAAWAVENKVLFFDNETQSYSSTPPQPKPTAATNTSHKVLVLTQPTNNTNSNTTNTNTNNNTNNNTNTTNTNNSNANNNNKNNDNNNTTSVHDAAQTNEGEVQTKNLEDIAAEDSANGVVFASDANEGEGNSGQDATNEGPRFAMQVVSVDTKHLSTLRQRFTQRAQTAATNTKPLIVIDGPNVAMRHGKQKLFSSVGIKLCADYWQKEGHRVVAFLPDYYLDYNRVASNKRAKDAGFSVGAQKLPNDIGLLNSLVASGVVTPTPAQDYDDSYCIKYAHRHGGYIISNDRYKDFKGRNDQDTAEMKMWISAHLISYTFVLDEFLPNPDFAFSS